MPDCGTDYSTASFKGIEFEILPVTNTIGQRKVVNLYPFSDFHYNERLGRKPETWSVRGLFVGEDARDRLQVAKRIWRTESAGVFFEPTENRRHSVELNEDVVFQYDNKRFNYVTFTLELIESSGGPYPARAGGLFGQVNGIIDDFIDALSDFYADAMSTVSEFSDIISGFEAANDFLFDTTRQTVTSDGFVDLIAAVNESEPSTTPATTAENISAIFETARDNDAPLSFFQQSSETRVSGNATEETQGHLFALTGLVYYFETISNDGVTYSELQDFRDRAAALKSEVSNTDVGDAIDRLICEIGQSADFIKCQTLPGTHHGLVASYRLYGDISRANDILEWSGGVSGAAMTPVTYR